MDGGAEGFLRLEVNATNGGALDEIQKIKEEKKRLGLSIEGGGGTGPGSRDFGVTTAIMYLVGPLALGRAAAEKPRHIWKHEFPRGILPGIRSLCEVWSFWVT